MKLIDKRVAIGILHGVFERIRARTANHLIEHAQHIVIRVEPLRCLDAFDDVFDDRREDLNHGRFDEVQELRI